MTRKQLIAELKLIACGACGGPIENIGDMVLMDLLKVLRSIGNKYFVGQEPIRVRVGLAHCETFETLADAIISEQERLKAVAKRKGD